MTKHRILVVDSDEDICKVLNIYFTGQGYEVALAYSGEEALSSTKPIA